MQQGTEPRMWQVTCQCGWRTRGTRQEVVPAVQEHGRTAHGLDVSEEDVVKLAVADDQA